MNPHVSIYHYTPVYAVIAHYTVYYTSTHEQTTTGIGATALPPATPRPPPPPPPRPLLPAAALDTRPARAGACWRLATVDATVDATVGATVKEARVGARVVGGCVVSIAPAQE